MLVKLFIHQYRCLQNFEIDFSQSNSTLVLGKNGSGKTTIFEVVEIFQKIGQGESQIKNLIFHDDFAFKETNKPILFEVQAIIKDKKYQYILEIELPENVREPKIKKETLIVNSKNILLREGGRTLLNDVSEFTLDWHHIGLPLVSVRNEQEPIAVFKSWLRDMIVLTPYPRKFSKASRMTTTFLDREGEFTLDWARNLLADLPSLYSQIYIFLKHHMSDLESFRFDTTGKNEKELIFIFQTDNNIKIELNFDQLSDGEKVFFLTATIIAAIYGEKSILCLWDEPDNYISLSELSHFISKSRKAFEIKENFSQLFISTHNPRVINEFSSHNTYVLSRSSHLQPSRIKRLQDIDYVSPSVVDAYENGELD